MTNHTAFFLVSIPFFLVALTLQLLREPKAELL